MSLIPRFYDPTAGTIALDGRDLRDYKVHPLRDQIGYVLQETVLFRGTIRENIAYGRPDASEQEIIAAAKLANADEFIVRMPHGYDSHVGERGDTLSGGQRAADRHRARGHPRHAALDPRRADGGARHRVRAPGRRGARHG